VKTATASVFTPSPINPSSLSPGAGQIPLKKAINQAIDRPALARTFGYLAGRRTDQMLPPTLGRDASIDPLRGADVSAAKRSYAQAGLKPDKLVLYAFNVPTGVAAAQVLAFNLKQIGIDLEVRYFDGATLAQRAATRSESYDLVSRSVGCYFIHPVYILDIAAVCKK
jgi:ABC-type transport system substrate-binding protein